MDKNTFLTQIQTHKTAFHTSLAELTAEQLTAPNTLANGWSLKDLLAHITWYEREMVELLSSMSMADSSPRWGLPHDERNQAIYEENQDKPLAEVQSEAEQVYQDMLAALTNLDEAALHDASHFAEMPPDWTPWELIAGNADLHYADHIQEIKQLHLGD